MGSGCKVEKGYAAAALRRGFTVRSSVRGGNHLAALSLFSPPVKWARAVVSAPARERWKKIHKFANPKAPAWAAGAGLGGGAGRWSRACGPAEPRVAVALAVGEVAVASAWWRQ